jgi:hypothetical protein
MQLTIELTKEDQEELQKKLSSEEASLTSEEKHLLKALLEMAKKRGIPGNGWAFRWP